jgi:hypothetical protein
MSQKSEALAVKSCFEKALAFSLDKEDISNFKEAIERLEKIKDLPEPIIVYKIPVPVVVHGNNTHVCKTCGKVKKYRKSAAQMKKDELKDKVFAELDSGKTVYAVALELKIDRSHIYRWINNKHRQDYYCECVKE